ncbi:MAG TPA: response regulator [Tenuifilaceae bacterium]|nr:response regulator [Tenuifilaceae bacterium]HQB78384.1 response regulator [Tenuifilaceae bacterium]
MKKVLVAEDSPLSRQIIEAFLSNIEIDLHFAVDGDEAYAKAIEINPDLVILDIMMPGSDGIKVTEMLRERDSLKLTPIIIFTALEDRDTMQRCLKAGATDIIHKPLKRDVLLEKISIHLK